MSTATMTVADALGAADRLCAQGDLAGAVNVCRQIVRARPGRSEARVRLAYALAMLGREHEAQREAQACTGVSLPDDLYLLGETWMRLGQPDRCIDAYLRGLQHDPSKTRMVEGLAEAMRQAGRGSEATRLEQGLRDASDARYQSNVQNLRTSRYMDYPSHVHFETMARCNAACTFCPSPVLERSGARMDDALIHKIIEDLTDMPSDLPLQLSPFKVNEPFLDVRLFDILHRVHERLPNANVTLTTNGSVLTAKKLRQLRDVQGVGKLFVSFNDHRREQYEATMKLPYGRTVERLDALHQAVASGELSLPVILSRVSDVLDEDMAFRAWCRDRWPRFDLLVLRRGDWLGQVQLPSQDVPDIGCMRWFELSITATGVVAHCCMDGQAKWPIGDVRTHHVLDVYNDPSYRRLREHAVTRASEVPCNNCSFR